MKWKHLFSLILILAILVSCAQPAGEMPPAQVPPPTEEMPPPPPKPSPALAVELVLESPQDGSLVPSLTPKLGWKCSVATASYRLQIAADSNFENIITDERELRETTYTIPSEKLSSDRTYYWRVSASSEGATSGWSSCWSFKTPVTPEVTPISFGTIAVSATLDGSPWSGAVSYTMVGPGTISGSSVPQSFSAVDGSYTFIPGSGGPKATLVNITPSETLTLTLGSAISFVMNFEMQVTPGATGTIIVNATLDGEPWSGEISYAVAGPDTTAGASVSQNFSNKLVGTYTLTYNSGGPSGVSLTGITPSQVQTLVPNSTVTFTLNFSRPVVLSPTDVGTIVVNATLDGSSWTPGPGETITYTFTRQGGGAISGSSVPQSFTATTGTWDFTSASGGPSGARLKSISPNITQVLTSGHTITFTLEFTTKGRLFVEATLDGSDWSGELTYHLNGPGTVWLSSDYIPCEWDEQLPGTYSLIGPSGVVPGRLVTVTPSRTQTLSSGGTVTYTLNFISEGFIMVYATFDGGSWSGAVNYTLSGPEIISGTDVPSPFLALIGTYTLTYDSGGPPGAILSGTTPITPSSTQTLHAAGDFLDFTLNFVTPPPGTITVNATLNGSPWSGSVYYSLAGPQLILLVPSVPHTYTAASGSWTCTYNSGGPTGAPGVIVIFDGVTPSATRNLPSGGQITFTLNFHTFGVPPPPQQQ